MARLTSKKFIEFINKEFNRFGIKDWKAFSVFRTRYTKDQYENGACKLIVKIKHNTYGETCFTCFYSLGEYQDHINCGFEMYMRFHHGSIAISVQDLEIDLRKK